MDMYDLFWETYFKKKNIVGRRDNAQIQKFFEDITTSLEPDLVIEIGAFNASFSVNVSEKINSKIVAYEANKNVYEKYTEELNKKIEYNHNLVAGDCRPRKFITPLKMKSRDNIRELSSVNRMSSMLNFNSTVDSEEVTFEQPETIDSIVKKNSSEKCVVWADVEGASGEIMFGAKDALSSGKIAALFLEVEKKEMWSGQWTYKQIRNLLKGFNVVPVCRDYQTPTQFNEVYLLENEIENVVGNYEEYINSICETA